MEIKKEIITIKNVANKIQEKENQLDYYIEKKNKALLRVLPKAKQLNGVMVSSSRDVTDDNMLNYVAEVEQLDKIITILNEQLIDLQKFEEKELKRLSKYDEVETQVIHYKDMGKSWKEIGILIDQRVIACSLRTAKRIWRKEKGIRDVGE